jgi:hypothetical protein
MPQVLTIPELKSALNARYSTSTKYHDSVRERRQGNIDSFLAINRDGLQYDSLEHRVLLHTTKCDERLFVQFPGKESPVNRKKPMPYDFRPKIQYADGAILKDASFSDIWDILENVGKVHNGYLCLVAALIFRLGHMYDYSQITHNYECEALSITGGEIETIRICDSVKLCWRYVDLSDDVWYSLNGLFDGLIKLGGKPISFEAFIWYIDLLFQNEDCKYYYRNRGKKKKLEHGRVQSCKSILLVIDYLKGNQSISALLGGFISGNGVANFKTSEYSVVTDGIVVQ